MLPVQYLLVAGLIALYAMHAIGAVVINIKNNGSVENL